MNTYDIEAILLLHTTGKISAAEAAEKIKNLSYENIGYARVDHARAARQGFPEVIFGQGKTREQILGIFEKLVERAPNVLITRTNADVYGDIRNIYTDAEWHEAAKVIRVFRDKTELGAGEIAIVTAGTSDIPVAEEAALTAETMGNHGQKNLGRGRGGNSPHFVGKRNFAKFARRRRRRRNGRRVAVGRRRSRQSSGHRRSDFHRLRRIVRRHRRAFGNAQFVCIKCYGRQY